MKAKLSIRLLLALAVAVIAGYAVYASLAWPRRAALFPRLIGIPLFFMALIEMFLSAFVGDGVREAHAIDFEFTKDVDPTLARKRTLAIFLWVFGFFFLILSFGFPVAVPLFVFFYLKFAGSEGWSLSIVLTLVSWIFIEGLFDRVLHIPMPQGWLVTLVWPS